MRKLVVGDIHGNCRGLVKVLEDCAYEKEYDQLICVGDYVDGWSESFEVVELLISIQKQAKYKPIYIRGNHDVWCEEFLNGQHKREWLSQGGAATLESYLKNQKDDDIDQHRKFFRGLHNYYIDDDNRAFIHGGFTSRKGVGYEPYQSNYYWDRDLWNIATILHRTRDEATNAHATRMYKHKEIFIGHTTTTGWNCKNHYPESKDPRQLTKNGPITVPMNRLNIWNIDTGGGYDGCLTVMDVDSKEYWQAPRSKELYPGEMRNYK